MERFVAPFGTAEKATKATNAEENDPTACVGGTIAFIRGPKMLADSGSRWKGLRAYAKSAGITIDEKLVAELPDQREPNADASAKAQSRPALAPFGEDGTAKYCRHVG